MRGNINKLLRNAGKILAFFFVWAVLAGMVEIPSDNPAIWRFYAELIPFAFIAAITAVFWAAEKRRFPIIGFSSVGRNILKMVLAGVLWLGFPVLALLLTNTISFSGTNHIRLLPVWFISCILNVIMQELLVRGYIYRLLKTEYSLPVAAVFTTALFTLLHGGAFDAGIIPVLCVVSMSLLMTAALEYSGSLLFPIALHSIWNCIGAVVLNVVGLADDYPHILNAVFSGNDILTGGSCLIEGSAVVLLMNVIMLIYFASLCANNRKSITKQLDA